MTCAPEQTGQVERLAEALDAADAVLVGAGAGLSTSAGLTYGGERFMRYFADFHAAYGIRDMYAGGFYPFATPEEYWAWWSRHIMVNRYDAPVGEPYRDLLRLLDGRDFFVLTTNVDHQFQRAGIDRARLCYLQGDYGLWQCSKPCHRGTYDNEAAVRRMAAEQRNMRVPSELLPRCPVCGAPMAMNLRIDGTFVEDEGWHAARARYEAFAEAHAGDRLLLLELGVGGNTPGIVKYPFWRMAARNPRAFYACVNRGEAYAPRELGARALALDADIGAVLRGLCMLRGPQAAGR